jgi:hypothetical protein
MRIQNQSAGPSIDRDSSNTLNAEQNIQNQLELNVSHSDTNGVLARRDELVKEFQSLSPQDAQTILQRLQNKNSGDPLNKLFYGKLSDASCNRLFNILKQKNGNLAGQSFSTHSSKRASRGGEAGTKKLELGLGTAMREFALRNASAGASQKTNNAPIQTKYNGDKEIPDARIRGERSAEDQAKIYGKYEKFIPTDKRKDGPNQMNIVGLRHHDITSSKNLQSYDDRFVVIWKDKDGAKHAKVFEGATHPGQKHTSPRYEDVTHDGKADIPYIKPGTYEFKTAHSNDFRFGDHLRPTQDGIAAYRDINQDGKITGEEFNAQYRDARGILFHKGGPDAPISIGCQTLAPDQYEKFIELMKQDPDHKINYTLVDAHQ